MRINWLIVECKSTILPKIECVYERFGPQDNGFNLR